MSEVLVTERKRSHVLAVSDSIPPSHIMPQRSWPSLTRAANCLHIVAGTGSVNFSHGGALELSLIEATGIQSTSPDCWAIDMGLRYYNWKAPSIAINNEVSQGAIRGWGRECVGWREVFSHISSQPVNPPQSEALREYDTGVKTQEGESLTLLHYELTGTGLCMTLLCYYS